MNLFVDKKNIKIFILLFVVYFCYKCAHVFNMYTKVTSIKILVVKVHVRSKSEWFF